MLHFDVRLHQLIKLKIITAKFDAEEAEFKKMGSSENPEPDIALHARHSYFGITAPFIWEAQKLRTSCLRIASFEHAALKEAW